MTFDPTKPVQTRDGRTADILAVLPAEKCTVYGDRVVALVEISRGKPEVLSYGITGAYLTNGTGRLDLVNVPTRHRIWLNAYLMGQFVRVSSWSSRMVADQMASSDRLACLELEFEEGTGLKSTPTAGVRQTPNYPRQADACDGSKIHPIAPDTPIAEAVKPKFAMLPAEQPDAPWVEQDDGFTGDGRAVVKLLRAALVDCGLEPAKTQGVELKFFDAQGKKEWTLRAGWTGKCWIGEGGER
jgi:hypothetical protein